MNWNAISLKKLSLLFLLPVSSVVANISYSGIDSDRIPFDHKLVKLMNFRNGTFIEVGANDGLAQSNTKLLEEMYGWTGVLVEPSETTFAMLQKNRPYSKCFQCALGTFEENETYVYGDFDGDLMSSVNGQRQNKEPTHEVLMRSLQSILDEVGLVHVNFFSLDTEGYEFNILQGLDFTRAVFDYLLIEIYINDYEKIVSYLEEKGYTMVECFSNYNPISNPGFSGIHNDYLFKRKSLMSSEPE